LEIAQPLPLNSGPSLIALFKFAFLGLFIKHHYTRGGRGGRRGREGAECHVDTWKKGGRGSKEDCYQFNSIDILLSFLQFC